jgi:branched-chain amino acid transport system ATP-binding protein
VLELREVRAGYGRIEVLRGLDLTVGEGEIIAVVGANGAGKSTLLKVISGIVRISAGSIEFVGERIDSLGVERAGSFLGR